MSEKLAGQLSAKPILIGEIKPRQVLIGEIPSKNKNEVLVGYISTKPKLIGEINSKDVLVGNISLPFILPPKTDAEVYEGDYEFTPTFTKQTVQTAYKLLMKNIKINDIQTYETSNEYGTTFII